MMQRGSNWALLGLGIFIVVSFVVFSGSTSDMVTTWYSDLLAPILALGAACIGLNCYRKFSKDPSDEKKTLLFLSIAFLLRFLGESLWGYYELFQGTTPAVSFADVLWLLSHVFVIVAVSYVIKNTFIMSKKTIMTVILSIATVVVAALGWLAYTKAAVIGYENALAGVVNFSYVGFDIYIVALFAVLIYPMLTNYNTLFKSFLLTAFGFIIFAIFDFSYFVQSLTNAYASGGVLDTLYLGAYALVLVGSYFNCAGVMEK